MLVVENLLSVEELAEVAVHFFFGIECLVFVYHFNNFTVFSACVADVYQDYWGSAAV